MRFGYSGRLRKLTPSRKQLMVAVGLLAVPVAVRIQQVSAVASPVAPDLRSTAALKSDAARTTDLRTVRLSKFFSKLQCPVRSLSADFVKAADDNHLDWRLLPSISVVESGGGRVYRNNNIFGWSNGSVPFTSIRRSIHDVAYKLGFSPLYRHRDTLGKLRAYNSDKEYAQNVLEVMNRISPDPELNRD